MARRSRRDEDLDTELGSEPRDVDTGADTGAGDGPSRSARKRASEELQGLGEQLAALPADTIAALPLPERVKDAAAEAKRLKSFGAQKRQAQFIGKLMRRLDSAALAAVRDAVRVTHAPSAAQTALLHEAERARDALLASDAEVDRWLAEAPDADAQRLRGLIREARSDARATLPGEAPRRGRAYREIFAIVRARLDSRRGL
jgi:ribosome-associated protein